MIETAVRQPVSREPEVEVAVDLARRAAILAPVALLGSFIGWGLAGALSAGFALGLVALNFLAAATAMARAARISLHVLMATVLASYVLRLAIILAAVLAVAGRAWFEPIPFGSVLVGAHLSLLLWETRYVSASLAFPGLKPKAAATPTTGTKE